ncbi:MAG: hypothetical protein DRJ97_05135 [Thermoprotei archaeon]|nr:MAG: hypothetical protein DRJ97_05135 [Thermoprotei archaeon]
MSRYVVFRCRHCGQVQATMASYSKRRCPYCGQVNEVSKVQVLAYASSAREASEAVSAIKLREAKGSSLS